MPDEKSVYEDIAFFSIVATPLSPVNRVKTSSELELKAFFKMFSSNVSSSSSLNSIPN